MENHWLVRVELDRMWIIQVIVSWPMPEVELQERELREGAGGRAGSPGGDCTIFSIVGRPGQGGEGGCNEPPSAWSGSGRAVAGGSGWGEGKVHHGLPTWAVCGCGWANKNMRVVLYRHDLRTYLGYVHAINE